MEKIKLIHEKLTTKNSAPSMNYEDEAQGPNRGIALAMIGCGLGLFWYVAGVATGWLIWH